MQPSVGPPEAREPGRVADADEERGERRERSLRSVDADPVSELGDAFALAARAIAGVRIRDGEEAIEARRLRLRAHRVATFGRLAVALALLRAVGVRAERDGEAPRDLAAADEIERHLVFVDPDLGVRAGRRRRARARHRHRDRERRDRHERRDAEGAGEGRRELLHARGS